MSDNRWVMPDYEGQLICEQPLRDKFLGKELIVEPGQRAVVTVKGKNHQSILKPGHYKYDLFQKSYVKCTIVDVRTGTFPIEIDDEIILGTDPTKGVPVKRFVAVVTYKPVVEHIDLLISDVKDPLSQLYDTVKMVFADIVSSKEYDQILKVSRVELSQEIFKELPVESVEELYLKVINIKVTEFTPDPKIAQIRRESWEAELKSALTGLSPTIWLLDPTRLAALLQDEYKIKEYVIDIAKSELLKTLVDSAGSRQELITILEFLRPNYITGSRQQSFPFPPRIANETPHFQISRQESQSNAHRLLEEQDLLINELGHERVESRFGPENSRIFTLRLVDPEGNFPLIVTINCPDGFPQQPPQVTVEVVEEEGRTEPWSSQIDWTEKKKLVDVASQIQRYYYS